MFLLFTPFSYFFVSFYFIFLIFSLTASNFIIFWVFMEFIILIFMGLSYTLFNNNFSALILYFLIQTLSSFLILVFYLYPMSFFFTLSVFIKLSMFPFHFWFLNVCYRFPNFVLFLSSSFHNIPLFLILILFHPVLDTNLVFASLSLTLLLSGLMMLSSADFRSVVISSSIGNNSWFLLSSIVDLLTFLFFFIVYSVSLYLLFHSLSYFSNPSLFLSPNSLYTSFLLVLLSGLPPFPIFFSNIVVLALAFTTFDFHAFLLVFIVCSCLILVGYLYCTFKFFIYCYTSQPNYFTL